MLAVHLIYCIAKSELTLTLGILIPETQETLGRAELGSEISANHGKCSKCSHGFGFARLNSLSCSGDPSSSLPCTVSGTDTQSSLGDSFLSNVIYVINPSHAASFIPETQLGPTPPQANGTETQQGGTPSGNASRQVAQGGWAGEQ